MILSIGSGLFNLYIFYLIVRVVYGRLQGNDAGTRIDTKDPLFIKLSNKEYRRETLNHKVDISLLDNKNKKTFFCALVFMAAISLIPLFLGDLSGDDAVTKKFGVVVGFLAAAWFAFMIPRYWGGMKP